MEPPYYKGIQTQNDTDKWVTTRFPNNPHTNFKIKVNDTIVNQVNKLIIWEKKQIQKQK
jgi:hypothetical protein